MTAAVLGQAEGESPAEVGVVEREMVPVEAARYNDRHRFETPTPFPR